jgi:hypothetical protein
MKLKVPHFKQRNLLVVPLACNKFLAYYGKKISLTKFLNTSKCSSMAPWTSYLGVCGIELGFKAKLVYYNVDYVDPTWFGLSRERLIKKLEALFKKRET